MRIGVVAEGRSDFMAIEAVIKMLDQSIETELLQPDATLTSGRPNGWRGVRAWCEENGRRLEAVMRGVTGRELDVLVVHVDCSMAHNVQARRPCPPARDTADALRAVVLSWLGRNPPDAWVVVVTPAQMTDAWVVAALTPRYANLADIECDLGVEDELARRRLLRRRDGEVKKPRARYLPLVMEMVRRWRDVQAACGEAARFETEARGSLAAVRSGGGPRIRDADG